MEIKMIKKGVQNSAYVHNYVNIDFGQDVGGMSEKDRLRTIQSLLIESIIFMS